MFPFTFKHYFFYPNSKLTCREIKSIFLIYLDFSWRKWKNYKARKNKIFIDYAYRTGINDSYIFISKNWFSVNLYEDLHGITINQNKKKFQDIPKGPSLLSCFNLPKYLKNREYVFCDKNFFLKTSHVFWIRLNWETATKQPFKIHRILQRKNSCRKMCDYNFLIFTKVKSREWARSCRCGLKKKLYLFIDLWEHFLGNPHKRQKSWEHRVTQNTIVFSRVQYMILNVC